jgi:hypothetical protein
VKALTYVMLTGLLLGAGFVDRADAGQRREARPRRAEVRVERRVVVRDDRRDDRYDRGRYDRRDRYFRDRDVVVIRDYYRPYYRPVAPGLRRFYVRNGYLPNGWARRIRPVPVYIERDLYPVPRGYRRGLIDGHVVVHNERGLIFDVAMLF